MAEEAEMAPEPAPDAAPEIDWDSLGRDLIERHGDLVAALPD
jgi:hypothetical protein